MVKRLIPAMSLTGNGFRDWLIQRFSSIILSLYFLVLIGFFFLHPHPDFVLLKNFFDSSWMQMLTVLSLLCLLLHAWVGVWTIITDYIKPVSLRLFLQGLVILSLIIYFFWGIAILWKS